MRFDVLSLSIEDGLLKKEAMKDARQGSPPDIAPA